MLAVCCQVQGRLSVQKWNGTIAVGNLYGELCEWSQLVSLCVHASVLLSMVSCTKIRCQTFWHHVSFFAPQMVPSVVSIILVTITFSLWPDEANVACHGKSSSDFVKYAVLHILQGVYLFDTKLNEKLTSTYLQRKTWSCKPKKKISFDRILWFLEGNCIGLTASRLHYTIHQHMNLLGWMTCSHLAQVH